MPLRISCPIPFTVGRLQTRQWRSLRGVILARDQWQCQIAGPYCTRDATEVDHVTPRALGGSDDPSNLRSVCHDCHKRRGLTSVPTW